MNLHALPRRAWLWIGLMWVLALFLVGGAPLSAAPDSSAGKIDPRLRDLPGQEEYPRASALIVIDDLTYTLNPDYSAVATEHNAVKILTENGAELFSLAPRPYWEGSEKIEFLFARTITPQGQVLEVDLDTLKTIEPISNVPAYAKYKILVAQLPQVEVGSIVEYAIKTTYQPRPDKAWWTVSFIQNDVPLLNSTFKVTLPQEVEAHTFTNVSHLPKPKIEKRNGQKSYYWETDRPYDVLPDAVSMPSDLNYYKYIAVSPFANWEEMGTWAAQVWRQNTDDPQGKLNLLSARLTSVSKPTAAKIADILKYMGQFSVVDKGSEYWRPADLVALTEGKQLTYPDAAYLMGALLRKAGLRVVPYLTTTADLHDLRTLPPVPSYANQFMLQVVDPDSQSWWIDPSLPGGTLKAPGLGFQGSALLRLPTGIETEAQIVTGPSSTPQENAAFFHLDGRLETTGMGQLTADITYNGPRANILRSAMSQMQTLTPAQRQEIIDWIFLKFNRSFCFQTIPYSHYFPNQVPADQPLTFNTSVSFSNSARFQAAEGYFETPLPIIQGQSLQVALNTADRAFPIRFDAPFLDEVSYRLHLPPQSQVIAQPKDRNLTNPAGSYLCKTVVKGDEVWFYSRTEIKKAWYYPNDFAQLRELAQAQMETFKSALRYKLAPAAPASDSPTDAPLELEVETEPGVQSPTEGIIEIELEAPSSTK